MLPDNAPMDSSLHIGIIGDFDPERPSHAATNRALDHAARALSVGMEPIWLPTRQMTETDLTRFDAFLCAPGSPYKSLYGALAAIRFCREQNWPFVGT